MLLPLAAPAQRPRLRVHRPPRRGPGRPRASPACRRSGWSLGIAAFIATLARGPRRPRPRALPLHGRLRRHRAAAAAAGARASAATINGARIWVSIGPVNFQPGEFAKIVLAVFFAAYLVEKRELLGRSTGAFGPVRAARPQAPRPGAPRLGRRRWWSWSSEKDLGSSLLFFALFVVMLWVATERAVVPRPSGVLLFAGGAYFAYQRSSTTCRSGSTSGSTRGGPKAEGYQIVQAAFALADGGVTGTGLGLGSPDQHPGGRDRLHLRRHRRGARPARRHRRAHRLPADGRRRPAHRACRRRAAFEKLLATGLTTLLGVQAFIIIAGVIRLLPLTGVTLPFVSYGGSSLVANYVLLALLLRISDDTADAAERAPAPAVTAVGTAVNKQIRRLGVVPHRLLRRAVRAAQPAAGVRRPTSSTTTRATPARSCATSASPAGTIITADGVVLAQLGRRPTTGSSCQREYPEGDAVRPRHRLLHLHARPAGVEKQLQRRAGRAHASTRPAERSATCSSTRSASATSRSSLRNDVQQVGQRRSSASGEGSVVALDPRTGEILAMWSLPALRPQPAGRPRHRRRRRPSDAARRRPRASRLLARALPGALLPRLDVQGRDRHRRRRARRGHRRPARRTRSATATTPPRHRPRRSATSAARRCGGTLFQILQVSCNTAFAQMGVEHVGADAHDRRAPRRSASTRTCPSTCPAPRQLDLPHRLRATTRRRWPRRRSARTTCRPPRCRWRWWPPASPTAARS